MMLSLSWSAIEIADWERLRVFMLMPHGLMVDPAERRW